MAAEVLEKPEKYQKQRTETTISLLLPAHNEAHTIQGTILEFYNEIATKLPVEIIVSEDGSTDGTKKALIELSGKIPIKLILGKERKGYMKGVKDGLKLVSSDYVFFSDSDGQHLASDFWHLYEKRLDYDLIVGKKIKRVDPPHRILISKVFHLIIKALFKLPIRDPDTAYRLIRREVVEDVIDEATILKYSFWTEFTVRAFKKGYKVAEVPVVHRGRLDGSTRLYDSSKLVKIILSQFVGLFKLCSELNGTKS
jgi:glycosyltransferase involved in cell wall biosynthesis